MALTFHYRKQEIDPVQGKISIQILVLLFFLTIQHHNQMRFHRVVLVHSMLQNCKHLHYPIPNPIRCFTVNLYLHVFFSYISHSALYKWIIPCIIWIIYSCKCWSWWIFPSPWITSIQCSTLRMIRAGKYFFVIGLIIHFKWENNVNYSWIENWEIVYTYHPSIVSLEFAQLTNTNESSSVADRSLLYVVHVIGVSWKSQHLA